MRRHHLPLVLSLCLLSIQAFSATVTFKDGRVLKGDIVEENDNELILSVKQGSITMRMPCKKDKIQRIDRSEPPPPPEKPAPPPGPADTPAETHAPPTENTPAPSETTVPPEPAPKAWTASVVRSYKSHKGLSLSYGTTKRDMPVGDTFIRGPVITRPKESRLQLKLEPPEGAALILITLRVTANAAEEAFSETLAKKTKGLLSEAETKWMEGDTNAALFAGLEARSADTTSSPTHFLEGLFTIAARSSRIFCSTDALLVLPGGRVLLPARVVCGVDTSYRLAKVNQDDAWFTEFKPGGSAGAVFRVIEKPGCSVAFVETGKTDSLHLVYAVPSAVTSATLCFFDLPGIKVSFDPGETGRAGTSSGGKKDGRAGKAAGGDATESKEAGKDRPAPPSPADRFASNMSLGRNCLNMKRSDLARGYFQKALDAAATPEQKREAQKALDSLPPPKP